MPEQSPDVAVEAPPKFTQVPLLLFARGLVLLTVLLSLIISLHYYLGRRLISTSTASEVLSDALWALLWSGLASIFVGFIGGRLLPRALAGVVQWVGFGWMGTFGVLLAMTAASDVVLLVASLITPVDDSWRHVRAQVVGGLIIPTLIIGAITARNPALKRITIDIPGLGADLDGLRIVQLTDVHIGETLRRGFARSLVDRVNALKPDAIAITGDLIDGSVPRLRDEVAPLADLRAHFGVFFVTGNHEYYSGAAQWEAECRRLGMKVLHNQHQVLARGASKLVLAGVTDVEGERFAASHAPDIDAAFAGAPADAPRVLLAHQPRFAKRAAGHRVALQLSGHTHGGQIFPFMVFVRLQQPVVSGLRTLHGVLTYTSKGTGYWGPPFRLGPRGEITEITLRAAPATS